MRSGADNLKQGQMRFWWVNHEQTARQERTGGYLWSPKTEASGARSRFCDNMRNAPPGDSRSMKRRASNWHLRDGGSTRVCVASPSRTGLMYLHSRLRARFRPASGRVCCGRNDRRLRLVSRHGCQERRRRRDRARHDAWVSRQWPQARLRMLRQHTAKVIT